MALKFQRSKTAGEYRRGELAKDVLRLAGAGVALGAALIAPKLSQVIDHFHPYGTAERKRIWNAIHYLEQRGHIAVEERGADRFVTLTQQGRIKLNEAAIWELTITPPRRWDKKWRLVLFDIPQGHESGRQSFRLKLEDLGFMRYQRSVFIFPHECEEEVLTIARWFGIAPHVRYIVATEIRDTRHFAHKFDLQ